MVAMSAAPGRLEQVRTFLNTWQLPHDTREPVDRLPDLAADEPGWRTVLPDVPPPSGWGLGELLELRTVIRDVLGRPAPGELGEWLERHLVVATIGKKQPVAYVARDPGPVAAMLALVVEAVAQSQWARLKACPDCRHVFYDHTRNGSRTWCGMYAETAGGRACGSIAKVRAYRDRQRGS